MKRPDDSLLPTAKATRQAATRPGRVTELKGIIFQSDASSLVGSLFIRPIESFDRWQLGLTRREGEKPLAMHAGLHVVIEDGREFVAEQLVGTLFEDFRDALNWTPLEEFRQRDAGGWDVTVPATAFRRIDEAAVAEAVTTLNGIKGHAFLGEDCIGFIERVFGERRLFGDSPTGMALGIGLRVGDPALPLLERDAGLDERTRRLLRVNAVSRQQDPSSRSDAPNARVWLGRLIVWSTVLLAAAGAAGLWERRARRRPWYAVWR